MMMKYTKQICLLLIAGFILGTGCKKKETSTADISGIWSRDVSSVTFKLNINTDKSYSITTSGISTESGNYTSTGSTVNFAATAGPCSLIPAIYNYTVTGNTIIFVTSTDTCSTRSALLTGSWSK